MELKDILQIIKRRIIILVVIIILTLGITIYWTAKTPEKYETSFIITVQANREQSFEYQYSGYYAIQASELFINTIIGWVKSPTFVADIYKRAEIEFDNKKLKTLAKKIYARKVPPQNISLIITDRNKERAEKIANSTIALITEKTNEINQLANSAANFEIVGSKFITIPLKPNLLFNAIITFLVSLIIGLILIFAIEYFSPTINNIKTVKNIFKKHHVSLRNIKLKGLTNPETKESEKFRFLRSNISPWNKKEKFSIIVAGINEQQTTPLISANLALSFARAGRKTILIDADFSNPNIHELFTKQNEFGFSELLFDAKELTKYLQKTEEENLFIIPAGIKLSYASDTIERAGLEKVMEYIQKEADVIIINVPALSISSEAFPLFSVIKKALLIVKIGKTNIAAANYINEFLDEKEIEKNIIVI